MNDTQLQKIRKWFYNNSDTPQRQYINFTCNWSTQNAFFHQKRDDILKKTAENSEISAGHPAYLGTLQREITRQWNDLTLEERQEFQALANQWSSGSAPEAVKRRQAIVTDMQSLCSSSNIQDGILYAEAHHP